MDNVINTGVPLKPQPEAPMGFQDLVGKKGWGNLPRSIRERFAQAPAFGIARTYQGTMTKMNLNLAGRFFAFLCIPLGRPLPGQGGKDIPATAKVYTMPKNKGVMWERHYHFRAKKPVVVKSIKKINETHGLLEYTLAGLGMFLKVYEKDKGLWFESTDYFFQIGKIFIKIPHLITPGKALVGHADKGQGLFEFTLTFEHPLFGRLFDQAGLFHFEGDREWKPF